jgi:hypothetical protein
VHGTPVFEVTEKRDRNVVDLTSERNKQSQVVSATTDIEQLFPNTSKQPKSTNTNTI